MQDVEKYILAVDLGTTGPKVALVSVQGHILDSAFEETPLLLLPNGGAEQRPDDWWEATKRAIRSLLTRNQLQVNGIVALCCTTQWSGTVAVDERGHSLMNAIIWMDSRGAPYARRITDGRFKVEGYAVDKLWRWIRLTGGVPGRAGKDSIAHILFIKYERPDIYRATHKFLEPKDYLNLRLTGRFAASYDSIALHWITDNRDIARVAYDNRLIAMSEIDRDKLPDLQRAVDILGPIRPEVADELGLGRHVQVVTGTPDVQSAAIGSGAVQDFQAHLYIGTSAWLACHVPFKKTDVFHNIASLPSAIPGKYLVSNEQQTAGACLVFLRDNILYPTDELAAGARLPDVFKALDRIVASTPAGSGKVIFTPWLYGERTPVGDHLARGGLHNVSLQTTRAHLIRAVFEGVAFNARWLLGYVEKFVGRRLDAVNLAGGGANSDVWCQIVADVLDRPIRQIEDPILVNARGAAALASVALAEQSFDEIAQRVPIAHTYSPTPENWRLYDELYREFVEIYRRERGMFARLNRAA